MNRLSAISTALFLLAACGGGEPAQEEAPAQSEVSEQPEAAASAAQLSMPEWYQIDREAMTVTLDVRAGSTQENNNWNFNGYFGGDGEIVVPEGYEVTINFTNDDPNIAHSIGVDDRRGGFPGSFSNPTPVFDGGMSSNPTSMTESTMPGESETITFTASAAGDYSLVCYVPGHASIGMWVALTVSADDEAGVRE